MAWSKWKVVMFSEYINRPQTLGKGSGPETPSVPQGLNRTALVQTSGPLTLKTTAKPKEADKIFALL